MFEVSIYKGSERQMQVWGMSIGYAVAIFFGLVLTAAGYIIASISLGLGFLGLMVAMGFFVVYALVVFRLSKRFGKGGLSKAYARFKRPDVIRGGITLPSRLKHLRICSEARRK